MNISQSQLQYFELHCVLNARYNLLDDSDDETPTNSHINLCEKMHKKTLVKK
jgi:hypothetical protein